MGEGERQNGGGDGPGKGTQAWGRGWGGPRWRSGCRARGGARCPLVGSFPRRPCTLTGCSDLFWGEDPQEIEGALEQAQEGQSAHGGHPIFRPQAVRARPAVSGFQAPAGPASGPGSVRPGRIWRRAVGGRTGGLGISHAPGQAPGSGLREDSRGSKGSPSPLSQGAGLHHLRVWLLSRLPPSKNSSEPQSWPQTGGAASGDGRGLGPVGARAGQALPPRAAGGQPAESACPRPFSVGCTPLPSLFSLLPAFPPPSPSQETARPRGPLGRPGLGGSHTGLQSGPWYMVPTGRAECGGRGAGQAVLGVWPHPPRCVVRRAREGCIPLGTGRRPQRVWGPLSSACFLRGSQPLSTPGRALCAPRLPSFGQAACMDTRVWPEHRGWKAMDFPRHWLRRVFSAPQPWGVCVLEAVGGTG